MPLWNFGWFVRDYLRLMNDVEGVIRFLFRSTTSTAATFSDIEGVCEGVRYLVWTT
jgi:hypothetical protein